SAVQYRPGKILTAGGGTGNANPVVATTAVIDMNQPNPSWRTTAPIASPRYWHNLVSLPDGKVLAVGGGNSYAGLRERHGGPPDQAWVGYPRNRLRPAYSRSGVYGRFGRTHRPGCCPTPTP